MSSKEVASGAYNPERAWPSRHGVVTDWFIFRHIIEHFSRENGISAPFMSAFEAEDIKKGKLNVFKWSKVSFLVWDLLTGLWGLKIF